LWCEPTSQQQLRRHRSYRDRQSPGGPQGRPGSSPMCAEAPMSNSWLSRLSSRFDVRPARGSLKSKSARSSQDQSSPLTIHRRIDRG
jgi:hypothetical protein